MEMYSTMLSLLISCNQDTQHQTQVTLACQECDGSTNQRTEEKSGSITAFIPFPHPHQQSSKEPLQEKKKKIKLFFLLILISSFKNVYILYISMMKIIYQHHSDR